MKIIKLLRDFTLCKCFSNWKKHPACCSEIRHDIKTLRVAHFSHTSEIRARTPRKGWSIASRPHFGRLPVFRDTCLHQNQAVRAGRRGRESPGETIKVHYFNNRNDSSEPAVPDDRKQHPLAVGQAVKKCRNPVFPIIGCVPAVFLAQCSYPLQWIYPSPTTHPLRHTSR